MTRVRVAVTLSTFLVVLIFGTLAFMYAKGLRFDNENGQITPTGMLVIKSDPDGASVYINGELKTATNATLSLPPNSYDVRIEKEGYMKWEKRLTIEKEIVTEAFPQLFKSAPSLTAITSSGAQNPVPSRDMSKISFIIPYPSKINENNGTNAGLWIIDMINLPLGFSQEPRKVTDGNLVNSSWIFSPDDREILLDINRFTYQIPSSSFTPEASRINSSFMKEKIILNWEKIDSERKEAQVKKAPEEIQKFVLEKTKSFVMSPDERMILYTASESARIADNLIEKFPGASTQKEVRDIKTGNTYIYDIKEDRNFLIDEKSDDLIIEGGTSTDAKRRLSFFPTSRHLVLAEEGKITILDYDGTNRQVIFAGSYVSPFAFPALSTDRLIILLNLGESDVPNLYSLGIK